MGSDAKPQKGSGLPPFLEKTYDLVDDPSSNHIVSWSSMGSSFIIRNPTDFSQDLLPKYFKHNNFSSFIRQLNTYGFRKLCPDQWEFATEGFVKGKRDAMKIIRRRKPLGSSNSSCQAQDDVEGHHVQAKSSNCTIAAHHELEEKAERLQQEKKQLLDQLTKLQLEQQTTKSKLADLGDRLRATEECQQQLVSFYARVVNPSFWAQFAQQPPPPESDLLLTFSKKRRLIASEQVLVAIEDQQEALVGTGDSGDGNENIVGGTGDVPLEEGLFLGQLSLRPPCDRLLGSSPSSLSSDICRKEAQSPTECMEKVEHLNAATEHQRVLIGLGCSQPGIDAAADKQAPAARASWNNTKMTTPDADRRYEGPMRELSLCPSNQSLGTNSTSFTSITFSPPCDILLGSSPSSLSSDLCLKEAQAPTECMNKFEHLNVAMEHQRVLIGLGCSQPGIDGTDFSAATEKQAPVAGAPWNNTKMTTPDADKRYEGVMKELSLRPSSQSLGTNPMSLSSVTFNREIQMPLECVESSVDEVCNGQTDESIIHATCTTRLGDDRVALSNHLRDRLRTVASSAPKSLGGKADKMADGCGSNDGFWEKYLTESPCSTDTEPDSESNDDDSANPRERQFL